MILVDRKKNNGVIFIVLGVLLVLFSFFVWYKIATASGTKDTVETEALNEKVLIKNSVDS